MPHGIYAIDTGFHRDVFDAAYLVVANGHAAFIDTGTNFAVPRLLAALQALGLGVDAVDWVIPTHVHLDHAGGVGLLMQHLPKAKLLVHPRGARHMVDPAKLWAGAMAVYGEEEMNRSYGELVPVPAERVVESHDGQVVTLADRPFKLIDTPGHARHHHCIWDEQSRGWFTGDTFGLSYREFDTAQGAWIVPTSTPVQFEPEALQASVQRLLAAEPECVYLTHYGRVGGSVAEVQRLGALLLDLLAQTVTLGLREQHHPERHEALKAGQLQIFVDSLAAHGCTMPRAQIAELLAIDLELNAQGLAVWLDRPAA
ncbi:MBL fold metallo-hydrolase [beta proteobacterium AAP121]|nr:MBL fold metallo-hydrolase [beta proteobacterium AAP65]KPF97092.1 MBL fold metallo-hydrolase [beta proteobacterium AAP121]